MSEYKPQRSHDGTSLRVVLNFAQPVPCQLLLKAIHADNLCRAPTTASASGLIAPNVPPPVPPPRTRIARPRLQSRPPSGDFHSNNKVKNYPHPHTPRGKLSRIKRLTRPPEGEPQPPHLPSTAGRLGAGRLPAFATTELTMNEAARWVSWLRGSAEQCTDLVGPTHTRSSRTAPPTRTV